jgi:hypothetical protein
VAEGDNDSLNQGRLLIDPQGAREGNSMKLANTALPGLFRAADKASLEAQRRFLIASQATSRVLGGRRRRRGIFSIHAPTY